MLVIDPKACISCGLCEIECAASAIKPFSKYQKREPIVFANAFFSRGIWRKVNHKQIKRAPHGLKCKIKNKSILSVDPRSA